MSSDPVFYVSRPQEGPESGKECMFASGKILLEFSIRLGGFMLLYIFKEWIHKRNVVMDIFNKGFSNQVEGNNRTRQ